MSNIYLTETEISDFQRDGAVCVRGHFKDWMEPLRRGVEYNLNNPGPKATEQTPQADRGRFFDDLCSWQRIPEYRDFVYNSPAAKISAEAMGLEKSQFFHDHLIVKEPGTVKKTPWHHDMPYYDIDGMQTVSLWLPLDPVTEEVCVRYIAGSHKWNKLFRPRYFIDERDFEDGGEGFEKLPDIDSDPDQYKQLFWSLEPGDVILFDFRTVHGTSDVLVPGRRRGFATRWLGDDIRYKKRLGQTSPSYEGINVQNGDLLREDWFPIFNF